ncbi:K(+)-transporting ATPase subunit F [Streptomyces sp. NPDC047022]
MSDTTCEVPLTAENIVGLIVAIGLLAYLVVALIKPERF